MKKYSRFNYLFEKDNTKYIYNSMSNFLAELDEETYENLKLDETKLSVDSTKYPDELTDAKVFVSDEQIQDEINNSRVKSNFRRFENHGLTLVIAPTYHCNFGCLYCYESSRLPVYMDDQTADNIVKYVEQIKTLKSLYITWFGGEPLLNFKRIKSLTRRFLELGLYYNAEIITNGYLLTNDKIEALDELRIRSLQITIDGLGKEHDIRRPHLKGYSSFDKITSNLDNFYSKERNAQINIRVNIDKTNNKDYYELMTYLKTRYPLASVTPSFIFIKETGERSFTDCIVSAEEKFQFYHELSQQHGVPLYTFPRFKGQECIARHAISYVVGPNGDLFKCYDQIGNKEKIVGNLNDGSFNPILFNKFTVGADQLNDPKCLKCKLLFVCSGGCPMLRLENEAAGKELYNLCVLMKDDPSKFLLYHIDNKNRNHQK